MAFQAQDVIVGTYPDLTAVDSVQRYPAGTKFRGYDAVLGYGEFVYLKGLASTAVGETVKYDESGVTTRTIVATRGPIAVALSANTTSTNWGWYQVYGLAVVKAATVAADTPVFATATPGTVDDAVAATGKIDGAIFQTSDGAGATTVAGFVVNQAGTVAQASYTVAAGTALASLIYPSMNGNG
jgi:hypothetical protein